MKVENPSDKVVIMAMMEGLHLGPLFNSLSKNVPEPCQLSKKKLTNILPQRNWLKPNAEGEEEMIRGKNPTPDEQTTATRRETKG